MVVDVIVGIIAVSVVADVIVQIMAVVVAARVIIVTAAIIAVAAVVAVIAVSIPPVVITISGAPPKDGRPSVKATVLVIGRASVTVPVTTDAADSLLQG